MFRNPIAIILYVSTHRNPIRNTSVRQRTIIGPILLVLVGAYLLMQNFGWLVEYDPVVSKWSPALLIVLGGWIMAKRLGRRTLP